jgi:hypothetical protein
MTGTMLCIAIVALTEWACRVYRRRAAVPYRMPAAPPSHVRRIPR